MTVVNLTLITIDNEQARETLRVLIPADDALYGALESYASENQVSDRRFVASNIEISPDRGITLELSSGEMRYMPENWHHAWDALRLERRIYRCGEITQKLILSLFFFQRKRKHGQRKEGRADKEIINYLINLVHAYRLLMEAEKDGLGLVSVREATNALTYDAEMQDARFPSLMPDDGAIPWPESWTADGATPNTPQGIERLRKRADRDKPNGY
ncbi:hypothetical protein [Marinobacter sp. LV10MA510-1]|uniref:hypothetical protein n=1 Tax=Marinobacter sp. LV10MA510-1 TaxID=1415567 RepID=UPI000BF99496|nr:hypothetical protein [Marinobacter sp. LV10MA510-1]PFG11273.1 hypothetical protein ATI45_3783 [Marinobacter sp. LV10MA510-1]